MSERKGATILLGIIAIAALGFSGYTLVDNLFFSTATPHSGLILVGLWEDLERNEEYAPYDADDHWLVEFSNSPFNDSDHVSVSNNNTHFKLLQEGFYKITLLLLLYDVDPDRVYWADVMRNNIFDHCFDRVDISLNPSSQFHQIQSSVYVESTGLDNFTIYCYSSASDAFEIGSPQYFNQLSIEYNR